MSLGLAHDSDGRITLKTLQQTPLSQLIVPTATASLGLDIPITASLQTSRGAFDFAAGGGPELSIVDTNLFSGAAPTVTTKNFSNLLSFQNVSAAALLTALDQLSSYLGEFATSPAFNTTIPFTQGKTLGSLVNIGFAYLNQLSGLTAASGGPAFSSVQGLEELDGATTSDPISFDFVPDFQTSTGATVPALELTFNFNQAFGGTTGSVITGDNLAPAIDDSTPLVDLNGGQGVKFSTTGGPDLSIALSDGTVFSVTFQNPRSIGDVITQIEGAAGNDGRLKAAINADSNGLLLTDLTLGNSLFNVIGQQGSAAVLDLGLVGIGFGNPTLDPTTPLSHLNQGAGVSLSTTGGPDLVVTLSNGTVLPITFSNPKTVADLISQVGAAPGNNGKLTLGFNATGNGLALFDTTGAAGLKVQAANGSTAAADLGLIGSGAAGAAITAGTQLDQLNGGRGVGFATTGGPDLTFTFADGTALDIALADPTTVGDLINQINSAAGNNGAIIAAINAAGNGLTLTGARSFTVQSDDGTTAADLGVAGASTGTMLHGRNLNPAVINGQDLHVQLLQLNGQNVDAVADRSTLLSDLNTGKGAAFVGETGKDLEIRARDGTVIDVALGSAATVGAVIDAINAASTKVVASLGKTGLILTDKSGGSTVPFTIQSLDGSTVADDLGIDEAPITAPVAFDFNLGGLASLKSSSTVFVQANVNASFTVGILLQGPSSGTTLSAGTLLSSLQDGTGVQFAGGGTPDLNVTLHDGTSVPVSLDGSTTVGVVLAKLNAAAPGKLTAALSATGLGLTLSDLTTGTSTFAVTALNGSSAPAQLGLLGVGDATGEIEGIDLSGNSLADDIFIQNAMLGGQVTLGGTVNASASFGFLGVDVQGGTVSATVGTKFTLGNLESSPSEAYSTLSDLTGALGNVAMSVVAANPGPVDGHTGISYGHDKFQIQIGQGPIDTVTIQNVAVPNPTSLADLIVNLNQSLSTAKDSSGKAVDLSGQVRALESGGSVAFTFKGGVAQTMTILGAAALGFAPTQSAYVVRPSVNLIADLNMPISLATSFPGVNPASLGTGIQLSIPSPGITFDLDYSSLLETPFANFITVNLGQLQNLSGFNFQTFASALNIGLTFLSDTALAASQSGNPSLAFLDVQLPLVEVSLHDILNYATAFSSFLVELANNPAEELQDVANDITSLLGLPSGAVSLELDTSVPGKTALRLDLNYVIARYSNTFTPSLSLSDGNPIGFSVSTTANFSAMATFQLALGIGLEGNCVFKPFLYDYNTTTRRGTGLVLGAYASANPINASADLGPIGVSVQSGYAVINNDGTAASTTPAQIVVGLKSPATPPPSGLIGGHTLTDPIVPDLGVVQANAHIGVNLPLSVGIGGSSTSLFDLKLSDDLTNPLNPTIMPDSATIGTAIQNALGQVSLFSGLRAGFDALFGPLAQGVDAQVLGSELPLIGPGIASAATFLADLKSDFDAALDQASTTLDAAVNAIYDEFGPPGLNWLQPIPGDTSTGASHYILAQSFLGGPDGPGFQFYIHLKQNLLAVEVPLAADLGIPGLGLNVSGDAFLQLGWDLQLGFGLNTSEGFYINSSQFDATANPYPTSFGISAHVTLENPNTNPPQPLSATGSLGYLQIKATDDAQQPTDFSGAFAISLADPGSGGVTDGHVTFAKLAAAGFSQVVNAGFNASASVNLDLSTNFSDAQGNPSSALPQLRTIFRLDWPFSATTTAGITSSSPSITFDQVQINLGTFLENFAGEVLGTVKHVLAPIQPVIDVLTSPIPVISKLVGHNVNLIELAGLFGQNDTANFLQAVVDLNSLINNIPPPGTDSNVWIDLGSFTIDGSAAKDPARSSTLTPKTVSPATLAQITAEVNQNGGRAGQAFESGVTNLNSVQGGGISFPILSNPLEAFQVLLGNDGATPPSLFELTLPTLNLGLKYTQSFPVPGLPFLAAQLSGQVGATFSFAFGFDTKGLSEYKSEPENQKNVLTIFDGFYIVDPPTANQVVLTAGIAASAVIDAYFVTGGLTGGLFATVNFHLHNDSDDPRLRFDQFGSQLLIDPLGIFDVSGDFKARLFAFVEVYYFFGSYRKEFDLASVTLLSFNTNPQAGLARDVTTVTASSSPAVNGQQVTFTATVRPTSTSTSAPVPAGSVQFFDATTNTNLGTATLSASGVASLSVSNLRPGNHVIQASYTSTNSYRSSKNTLTDVVTAASTTTTVGAGPANPVYGQPQTVTATVAAAAPGAGPQAARYSSTSMGRP